MTISRVPGLKTICGLWLLLCCAAAAPAQRYDHRYLVGYAANLNDGDATITISNSGARGADLQSGTSAGVTGAVCANIYAFSPDEQMISCCSCPVTPNGMRTVSANRDLISNTLTPVTPPSIVVKLVATVPVGSTCTHSAASISSALSDGLLAWGTNVHSAGMPPPAGAQPGPFTMTASPFLPATLSGAERIRLGTLCNFILANGSGYGVCRACSTGPIKEPPVTEQ